MGKQLDNKVFAVGKYINGELTIKTIGGNGKVEVIKSKKQKGVL